MTPPDARDRLAGLIDRSIWYEDGEFVRPPHIIVDILLADPRTLLAAALATDEGKAALAEALQGWWAAPEGSMPGTTEWTNAGGWLGDARAIAAELAKETE